MKGGVRYRSVWNSLWKFWMVRANQNIQIHLHILSGCSDHCMCPCVCACTEGGMFLMEIGFLWGRMGFFVRGNGIFVEFPNYCQVDSGLTTCQYIPFAHIRDPSYHVCVSVYTCTCVDGGRGSEGGTGEKSTTKWNTCTILCVRTCPSSAWMSPPD